MKRKLAKLKNKTINARRGAFWVLRKPRYIALAAVLAFLFAALIYFFINIGFFGPLMTSRLSVIDKLMVIVSMVKDMAASFVSTYEGAMLAIVAALQGIAFAIMIYTLRRNKRFNFESAGSGGLAMFAAALGLGCVPCGTSLIMPIVTLFASSSAYAAANTASQIVLIIAFGLSLYSLFKLGNTAYAFSKVEKQEGGLTCEIKPR